MFLIKHYFLVHVCTSVSVNCKLPNSFGTITRKNRDKVCFPIFFTDFLISSSKIMNMKFKIGNFQG